MKYIILANVNGEHKLTTDIVGISDMSKATYDPNNVENDVYSRVNHRNSINISDIYDIGEVAVHNIEELAAADHIHGVVADMYSSTYDPNRLEKDMYDQGSHVGNINVTELSGSASLNIGTNPGELSPAIHLHSQYIDFSTYDINKKKVDVYSRAGHTGTQDHETISDLGDGALLDLGTVVGSIAHGYHQHNYFKHLTHKDARNAPVNGDIFSRSNHFGVIDWTAFHDYVFTITTSGVVTAPQEPDTWLIGNGNWTKLFSTEDFASSTIPGAAANCYMLGGYSPASLLSRSEHTEYQSHTTISDLNFVPIAERDQVNGHISLNEFGRFESDLIAPTDKTLHFGGTWDADINSPILPDNSEEGTYYIVSKGGTTDVNGHSLWVVGDLILRDAGGWTRVPNSNAVISICGKTDQHIVLTLTDVLINVPVSGDVVTMTPNGKWGAAAVPAAPTPEGDMYTTTYDHWTTGTVSDAGMLNRQPASYYLDRTYHVGTHSVDALENWGPLVDAGFGEGELDAAEGDHTHTGIYMIGSSNLSEIGNVFVARSNLKLLGTALTNIGTTLTDTAAGNHGHTGGELFPDIIDFPLSVALSEDVADLYPVYPDIYDLPNRTTLKGTETRTEGLNFHSYTETLTDHGNSSINVTLDSSVSTAHKLNVASSLSIVLSMVEGSTIKLFLTRSNNTIAVGFLTSSGESLSWSKDTSSPPLKENGTNYFTFSKFNGIIYGSYVE